jgi:hypothetical protein
MKSLDRCKIDLKPLLSKMRYETGLEFVPQTFHSKAMKCKKNKGNSQFNYALK